MSIDIVHLDKDNIRILDVIAEDVFDEKIDLISLTAYLAEESHILLVAVHENIVVGQILSVIHRHPDKSTELYIDDLGVAPNYQRQGVATSMMSELFLLGKKQGCEELWIATEPDNEQAKGFYGSLNLSVRPALIFEGKL